ncbi:MAG: peptidyl-prolyl cis-trans isomerase [Gemmatimonadota bacterium]|nr:peptidyl-prolyl cis-trans isomerase [Gemmatimonadota bacterium]
MKGRKAVAILATLWCCGGSEPAAVSVGPIEYSEGQLLGLSVARRASLAELTAFGLAVADSSTAALGAPLVERWIDDRRLEILAAELLLEQAGVEDDVLEARYLTTPRWELTVRHILFFSERWRSAPHREAALAKAERALESVRAGADFASTAAALSEEPGAEGRQGLLTPGREGSWVPEFWAAALRLEPGEISSVTETQYGYHILRLEDRKVVPFEEARSMVVRTVADEIGDPAQVLAAWMVDAAEGDDAQRAAALEEADARSITLPEGERAELERVWDDMVYRWSATLAFRNGMSPAEVAQAAMVALSDPSQGTGLVRDEISQHRELLDARYDLRIGRGAEG